MGLVLILGIWLAGLMMFGIGRKAAKQKPEPRRPESKEERRQREHAEARQRRRRDFVKFLADPRLFK